MLGGTFEVEQDCRFVTDRPGIVPRLVWPDVLARSLVDRGAILSRLKPCASRGRYTSGEPTVGDRTAWLYGGCRDLLRGADCRAGSFTFTGSDSLGDHKRFTSSDGLGNCKRFTGGQPLTVAERRGEPGRDWGLPSPH